MIQNLAIRGFKRFLEIDLQFRPLTVLTGLNGTGKSTSIQALLLVRQVVENPTAEVVQLNGPYGLALGEANDIIHPEASEQTISVTVVDDGSRYKYVFDVPHDRALNLPVNYRPQKSPSTLNGLGTAFSYLNAERLGPRDQLDVTAEDSARIGVGPRGEFTAQTLALHETAEVRGSLRHPRTPSDVTTLRTQVETWASDIIRPIRITAQWPPGITASIIRFQEPGSLSGPVRPANMGFGFSYALPVIVAGLLTPAGGILLVENPEAHLHPAGQSQLGRFLGRLAGSGAQVVVETHSDHVLNGIRLAVVEDQTVRPDAVVVHFFNGEPESRTTTIDVNARGGLSSWPAGFFDQAEDDLGRLTRARRPRH